MARPREFVSDYSGRQCDVHVMGDAGAPVFDPVRANLVPGNPVKFSMGPQKAAQRYVLNMIQELGTVAFDGGVGTELIPALQSGSVSSVPGVTLAFASASARTLAIMNADDNDPAYGETRDDEILVSADLEDVRVDRGDGSAGLVVALTSAAGARTAVTIPVSVR